MDIKEIRSKYPQYEDLSDQQLIDGLHKKYYQDIPKEQFYKKIGFSEQAPSEHLGLRGIGEDIKESLQGAPAAFGNMLKNFPGQVAEGAQQLITEPGRTARNASLGVLNTVPGAANALSNTINYFNRKAGSPLGEIPEVPYLQHPGERHKGDEFSQGLANFLPIMKAMELIKGLGGAGRVAGASALSSAAHNEDPLQGALIGGATEGLFKGAGKGTELLKRELNKFKPSVKYRGHLTPEELQANLDLTRGTGTGLGEVVESPTLKRELENVLGKNPDSGASEAMQETGKQVTDKGQALFDSLIADRENPGDINSTLQEALIQAEKDVHQVKREKYNEFNEEADKLGVKVGRANMQAAAKEALDQINESPELKRLAPKGFIKHVENWAKDENSEGNNVKLTDIFRGKLGEFARQHGREGSIYESRIIQNIQDGLEKDVDEAVEKSGNPKLHKLRDEAHTFYKENVVPFQQPQITKFTREGGDSDLLLSSFLKNSRVNDRSNLLSRLLTKIPSEKKYLVPYAYYSRAIEEGKLNPLKLKTLHKNLGPNQKNALLSFDKDFASKLDDYIKLVEKNIEPLTVMTNPKTGQRSAGMGEYFGRGLSSLLGFGAGNIPGAIAGYTAGRAIPQIAAKRRVNNLTSETYRENIVKKMIDNAQKEASPKERGKFDILKDILKGKGTSALLSTNQSNNEK